MGRLHLPFDEAGLELKAEERRAFAEKIMRVNPCYSATSISIKTSRSEVTSPERLHASGAPHRAR